MKHLVAPSLLAADFARLDQAVDLVNDSAADWLHFDVMDGQFVPNISFGFPVLEMAARHCRKPIDVHLMIERPEQLVGRFAEAGAHFISVHAEACPHLHRVIQMIREAGARPGVALNPHTPISAIELVLEDCDLVCLMSVNPGFGGQKFIYETLDKIRDLKETITTRNLNCLIEVDGGVGLHNAEKILQAGADVLVAGSSVYKSEEPKAAIAQLKSIDINTILA